MSALGHYRKSNLRSAESAYRPKPDARPMPGILKGVAGGHPSKQTRTRPQICGFGPSCVGLSPLWGVPPGKSQGVPSHLPRRQSPGPQAAWAYTRLYPLCRGSPEGSPSPPLGVPPPPPLLDLGYPSRRAGGEPSGHVSGRLGEGTPSRSWPSCTAAMTSLRCGARAPPSALGALGSHAHLPLPCRR